MSKIHDEYLNIETQTSLFDTYVSSVLNYACETWGFHKAEDIEKLHLYYLKRILNVRKSTVNYMVYFELGRLPMYVTRYVRMISYWLRLLDTDNCILKQLYEDMYESSFDKPNDKLNWSCKIRDLLCKYGFNDVWLAQNVVNSKVFLSEFKQRVIDNYISDALSFFENSSKCSLYQYIHDGHKMQFY